MDEYDMQEKEVTFSMQDVDDEKIIQQWDKIASSWATFTAHDIYREKLIAPKMMEMLGDIQDKNILDTCCGEGYFSRTLAKEGAANVIGIDAAKRMINIAQRKEREDPLGIRYHARLIKNMDCFESEKFDIVVSFMSIQDVRNYEEAFLEVSRVLVPKGRFLFSIFHPCFFSPTHGWEDDKYWKVDNYLTTVCHRHEWPLAPTTSPPLETFHFHRPLSSYINALRNCGFLLSHLIEPTASEQILNDDLDMRKIGRIPYFLILEAIKVQGTELDTIGRVWVRPLKQPETDGLTVWRLRLTYPFRNIPFIYHLERQHTVITKTCDAGRVDNKMGWLVLEMAGMLSDLEAAIQYLNQFCVNVERI